jgi:polyferredoxin
MVHIRRASQIFFLTLFVFIFIRTTLVGENDTGPLATFFMDIDPLVLISTFLASHSIMPGMLLALIVVGLTLVLGRLFCSWICPLGTVFNGISALRGGTVAQMIETGAWNRWQKSKYLLLTGLLFASLTGLHIAGLFDPIPLLYRTLATSIFPAFAWGTDQLFTWLYFADPGIGPLRITLVSEPIYSFLRANVLPIEPIAYEGGVLVGLFFAFLVVLALIRFRFWCKFICPLGALLGACSTTSRLELKNNPELCNDCRQCVPYCHGGCDPHLSGRWKKKECFFCFNCRQQCPSSAIGFEWKGLKDSRELIPPLPPRDEEKAAVTANG